MVDYKHVIQVMAENKTDEAFNSVASSSESMANRISVAVAATAAAAAGFASATVLSLRKLTSEATQTDKLAQSIGLVGERFSGLAAVAKSAGIEAGGFRDAIAGLQTKALESPEAFERLGLAVRESNGALLSGDQLLFSVADKLQRTESATARTAIATSLLGSTGRNLLPTLSQGSEELNRLAQAAVGSGEAMSQLEINSGTRLSKAFTELTGSGDSLFDQLATSLAPVLIAIMDRINAVTKVTGNWFDRNQELLQSGIQDFFVWLGNSAIPVVAQGIGLIASAWTGWQQIIALVKITALDTFSVLTASMADVLERMQGVLEFTGRIGLAEQVEAAVLKLRAFDEAAQQASAHGLAEIFAAEERGRELQEQLANLGQVASDHMFGVARAISQVRRELQSTSVEATNAGFTFEETSKQLQKAAEKSAVAWKTQTKEAVAGAQQAGQFIGQSFGSIVTGATESAARLRQVMVQIGQQGIQLITQQLTQHLAAKAAETTATTTAATAAVTANAASAASGAVASQASIPVVGPALGIAAMGAILAAVLGLLGTFNTGGFVGAPNGPNRDSVLAGLTPGELVLDRDAAAVLLRAMQGRGGAGAAPPPSGREAPSRGSVNPIHSATRTLTINAGMVPGSQAEVQRFARRLDFEMVRLERERQRRPNWRRA